jgi:protein TonB
MAPRGAQTLFVIPLIILQLAAMTGALPPPPKTVGQVYQLFSTDDYPPEAQAKGWEGAVVVDLIIRADGRPRSCHIVRSSGHQVLDVATCEIMIKRARFTPARDSNGRAVEDTFRTPPIKWLLADPAPEPNPEQTPQ